MLMRAYTESGLPRNLQRHFGLYAGRPALFQKHANYGTVTMPSGTVLQRKGWFGLALVLGLGIQGCSVVKPPDNASYTIGFTEAVFGLGIDPRSQHPTVARDHLLRWDTSKPVYVRMRGKDIDASVEQRIRDRLSAVYALAGIRLLDAPQDGAGVLEVSIVDAKSVLVNSFRSPCYASISEVEDDTIQAAKIVMVRRVAVDPESGCIEHEAMHTLGFGGHPHRLQSILSYTYGYEALTAIDKQLLKFLYSDNVEAGLDIGTAVSRFYASLAKKTSGASRSPVTAREVSLELKESESPLLIGHASISDANKRILYTRADGRQRVSAHYANTSGDEPFAYFELITLPTDYVFNRKLTLDEYVDDLDARFEGMTIREEGRARTDWSRIDYLIGESEKYACLFAIRYKDNEFSARLGDQLLYGHYCQQRGLELDHTEAQAFLASISVSDTDPIKSRQRPDESESKNGVFAILVSGNLAEGRETVSAFILVPSSHTAADFEMQIGEQQCRGRMKPATRPSGGVWVVECDDAKYSMGGQYRIGSANYTFSGHQLASRAAVQFQGIVLR